MRVLAARSMYVLTCGAGNTPTRRRAGKTAGSMPPFDDQRGDITRERYNIRDNNYYVRQPALFATFRKGQ